MAELLIKQRDPLKWFKFKLIEFVDANETNAVHWHESKLFPQQKLLWKFMEWARIGWINKVKIEEKNINLCDHNETKITWMFSPYTKRLYKTFNPEVMLSLCFVIFQHMNNLILMKHIFSASSPICDTYFLWWPCCLFGLFFF